MLIIYELKLTELSQNSLDISAQKQKLKLCVCRFDTGVKMSFLRSRKERIVLKKELYFIFISKYKKYETGKKMSFLYIYTISLSL